MTHLTPAPSDARMTRPRSAPNDARTSVASHPVVAPAPPATWSPVP
jgi:hypothetical protein